jgi:hypothetical protein
MSCTKTHISSHRISPNTSVKKSQRGKKMRVTCLELVYTELVKVSKESVSKKESVRLYSKRLTAVVRALQYKIIGILHKYRDR